MRERSRHATLTHGLEAHVRRGNHLPVPVDWEPEPTVPVPLLHHQEPRTLGTGMVKREDRGRKSNGSKSKGHAIRHTPGTSTVRTAVTVATLENLVAQWGNAPLR